MGNLTELLSKIQPAVYSETTTPIKERNSNNYEFVEHVATINVKRTVKSVIQRSFILEQMIEKGEIGIVGAMYDVETGSVEFYNDANYIKDEQNPELKLIELRH
jgi:carbonic anhydrase